MTTSSNVDQLLTQGIQFHSEGQLPQALQRYEQVLQLDPKHFTALHNTGIAAFQSGNFEAAASFIRSALAVDPEHAAAHNNLGNALREMQLMEEALRSYDRALALAADDANTQFNRAVTLQSLLRTDEALQAYEQALALDANDDQAWSNRGALLWQTRQHNLALINVEQALLLNPQNIEAHNHRGNVLQDLGQQTAAEESYRQAIALLPDYAEAYYNLGRLQLSAARYDEALASLDQAITLHPQHLPAYRQRALALRHLDQLEEAQRTDDAALALQAQLVAAYRQRGRELEQLSHYESAAAMYVAALELDKDNAELQQLHARALDNTRQNEQVLASLRHALELKMERVARLAPEQLVGADLQRDYESARVALEKLMKLAPANPQVYIDLGTVLRLLGLNDQALAAYERALALAPNLPLGHWNRALLLLGRGDYERGWPEYEWRWKAKDLLISKAKRHFLKPQWSGRESLKGKTILLHAEQGLGDAIQFARYATLAKQRGARVVLEVWQTLAPLMASLKEVDQVVVGGTALPAFDYHIPLLSLPLAFNTRVETIPASTSYLSSDPAKRQRWEARLGSKTLPRVGVVWSGHAIHGNDHNRSLPLSVLADLFAGQAEFICLQKEVRPADQALLDTLPVRQFSAELNDFSDTAALCDLMDVVITVDTSVAHLAGALGKKTWILLSTPFEWRWLEHGATSAWYPTATLYRQEQIGAWKPVIAAVATDLHKELGL
jgi:tetratricopeptide (TPR) repeat protein